MTTIYRASRVHASSRDVVEAFAVAGEHVVAAGGFADLGYAAYHGGSLIDWYGPERVNRLFAHRWFLDAGVGVAASSDYPCGPYEPLANMQSCVTRRGDDGTLVGAAQCITPAEALDLYTLHAADAAAEAAFKGRLAPGYLADFVVLEEDPLRTEPSRLGGIAVEATYVGGVPVWTRA